MKKYAVIGLGSFGMALAKSLIKMGAEVIAIDFQEDLIDEIKDEVTRAVILDSTDEKALRSQDIESVDVAIVAIGEDFKANVLTTALLKKMGISWVITRAYTDIEMKILQLIGADEVLNPEEESARRLSKKLSAPNLMNYFTIGENLSLIEIETPESFFGKTLEDIDFREKYQVNLVALEKKGEGDPSREDRASRTLKFPGPEDHLRSGDILYLIGTDAHLSAFNSSVGD